jgi:hypothetical protein
MSGCSLKAWVLSLGLLTGAWAVLMMALGSLLPATAASEGGVFGATQMQRRSYRTYPLWIARKLPCTNEFVNLDLTLALDTAWRTDGEWVDFVIQATLIASPSGHSPVDIAPAFAHVGFSSPQYGKAGHVHEMHTPLLGQPVAAELVVGIEQAMDEAGQLIVQPGQVRVDCT